MLLLDAPRGTSGDMLLAGLCALSPQALHAANQAVNHLDCDVALFFHEDANAQALVLNAAPTRYTHEEMRELIAQQPLSESVRAHAQAALDLLVAAETVVHGHAEFQELGNVDTLVLLLGTSAALEALGNPEVRVRPIGTGKLGPAAEKILQAFPKIAHAGAHELTTPTAAALLASRSKPLANDTDLTLTQTPASRAVGDHYADTGSVLEIFQVE